jgi:ribonucleoside-diphosphate reductase beta chain
MVTAFQPSAQISAAAVFAQFQPMPFELDLDEFIGYAADRAQRRLGAIESARGMSLAQIDLDYSPEQLEDRFGEEDAAALAKL